MVGVERAVDPPQRRIRWPGCWRLIPSRFPPIDLFERVADPDDLEAVHELEALTNPRLRDAVGQINLVPAADRFSGPGSSPVMAAFTHLNPAGSRCTDGSYGVYYAARTVETAVAETGYHRERFLRATAQPAIHIDMRAYRADVDAALHDVRGTADRHGDIYNPDSYAASQPFARKLRADRSNGISYDSVRDPGGECIAVFRPPVVKNCRPSLHLSYVWNGKSIEHVYEKRELEPPTS